MRNKLIISSFFMSNLKFITEYDKMILFCVVDFIPQLANRLFG